MKTKSLFTCILAIVLVVPNLFAQDDEKEWSNTPIEVKTIDPQIALVMKADLPMSEISTKMGEIYETVFTYISENQIQPAGPPIAIYYSFDPTGNIVFEAGVPVAGVSEGTKDIVCKEYPRMKAVTTLYKGSYENMEAIYNALGKYIEDNSLEASGITWEVYLTDPNEVKDPSMNQTLIYFQLK